MPNDSQVTACTNCGLCNTVDPIAAISRKETAGTRFKAVLAKNKQTSQLFYLATDSSAQSNICPSAIDLNMAFREARARCVKAGITTDANEKMREHMKKTGFPYETLQTEDYTDKKIW